MAIKEEVKKATKKKTTVGKKAGGNAGVQGVFTKGKKSFDRNMKQT